MWYCVDKWSRGFCAEPYGLGVWLTCVFGVCMGYAGFQCVPWACCAGWITLCRNLATSNWTLTTPLCILSWWMRWVLTIAIRHHNCQDLGTADWTLTTPLCILSWWTGEYCHNHQVSQLSGPKYFKLNTDHTPLCLVLVDEVSTTDHSHQVSWQCSNLVTSESQLWYTIVDRLFFWGHALEWF